MSSRNTAFRVNTAFLPIGGECTLPAGFAPSLCPCADGCSSVTRLVAQMKRYENEAVFGVLENKLLSTRAENAKSEGFICERLCPFQHMALMNTLFFLYQLWS